VEAVEEGQYGSRQDTRSLSFNMTRHEREAQEKRDEETRVKC